MITKRDALYLWNDRFKEVEIVNKFNNPVFIKEKIGDI